MLIAPFLVIIETNIQLLSLEYAAVQPQFLHYAGELAHVLEVDGMDVRNLFCQFFPPLLYFLRWPLTLRQLQRCVVQHAYQRLGFGHAEQHVPCSRGRILLERSHPTHGYQKQIPERMHLPVVGPAERVL